VWFGNWDAFLHYLLKMNAKSSEKLPIMKIHDRLWWFLTILG